MKDFRYELQTLINCHSKENGSSTPDFILADYMQDCLVAFDKATKARTRWFAPEDDLSTSEPPQGA